MKLQQQFLFILIFAVFLLGNAGHFMLPQVFTNTSTHIPAYYSDVRYNLHNLGSACQAYWADEGSSATCTVKKVSVKDYGFVQHKDVMIYGSGTKNNFCAVALHTRAVKMFAIDSEGQIKGSSKLLHIRLIYYSSVFILPLMIVVLTSWGGGYAIFRRERKYFNLWVGVTAVSWALFALITSDVGVKDYPTLLEIPVELLFIPVIYSILRAYSLIALGTVIENQNGKKLKRSGICLLGVVGVLLALNFIYSIKYSKYQENYKIQLVKTMKEIEKINQADPSQLQKMCRHHFSKIPWPFAVPLNAPPLY